MVVLLTGAEVVAVPFVRDAEVETGFIFEGVPTTALGRLCFIFGDSEATPFPLSAAEVDACGSDVLVPSTFEFSTGTVCCVSGL